MRDNLDKALGYIFLAEGGWALRDSEPGHAVNMGVSMQTFVSWRMNRNQPNPTFDDLKNLSQDEATQIYQALYAKPIDFDMLPAGIDYSTLDSSVNEGVHGAITFLRAALGFAPGPIDGSILWAARHHPVAQTIDRMCDARLTAKQKRPEWARFGPGWTNRIEAVRRHSKEMAGV